MTPEDHVQQAVLQYPALEEVLQAVDANLRAAALHPLTLMVREAQHVERRECAKIAVEYFQVCSDPARQGVAEEIATEILTRDAESEQPKPS